MNVIAAAAIVVATIASYIVGALIFIPWLTPILNTCAAFPFMVAALRRGHLRTAVERMLIWAAAMAVCATMVAFLAPSVAGRAFVNGDAYRTEMFTWVMTGRGVESTPSVFIPRHLRDAALFSGLALASGGALAMPMGAVLVNQMGTYVGSLAATSARPGVTLALAWHPWAVIRVVSFVILGVVLSAPLLARVFRFRVDWQMARRLAAGALAGLLVDVTLKAVAAPAWQRMLQRAAGW